MLGEKIAVRRKQLGWSQTELAQKIGIAPSRISEFESGLKTDCNLSTAKRLARALGCSIDYLANTWDEAGDMLPPPEGRGAETSPSSTRRRGRPRKVVALARASG